MFHMRRNIRTVCAKAKTVNTSICCLYFGQRKCFSQILMTSYDNSTTVKKQRLCKLFPTPFRVKVSKSYSSLSRYCTDSSQTVGTISSTPSPANDNDGSDLSDSNVCDITSESKMESRLHIPVMLEEVISNFNTIDDMKVILDLTFGAGGHTSAILKNFPEARVIALDRDPEAYELATGLANEWPGRVIPLNGRFTELPDLLAQQGIQPGTIDGALFDLGCSSMQFNQSERGFSLSGDGILDMRMDAGRSENQPTAADVVNKLGEEDLYHIIKKYGEESKARMVAHAIVESRSAFGDITSTHQLADIISSVFNVLMRRDKLNRHSHVATKTFQAIRIFVNNELNELNSGLHLVHKYLRMGGLCVAISFHSLEDRIVKRHFHDINLDDPKNLSLNYKKEFFVKSVQELDKLIAKDWAVVSKKVTLPSEEEVDRNPRSRSAKLRSAIKIRD